MQRIRADRRLTTTRTALLSALLACQDLEIIYSTIYKIVRYELKSKLKTPRPTHEKQAVGVVEAFQEFLSQRIEGIVQDIQAKRLNNKEIAYWCQDETRIGFRTESGKRITLKGVKPQQKLQWHYDYYYIYGLVEPIGGGSFFYEFSHFNSDCMSIFLEKFQQENTDKIHTAVCRFKRDSSNSGKTNYADVEDRSNPSLF